MFPREQVDGAIQSFLDRAIPPAGERKGADGMAVADVLQQVETTIYCGIVQAGGLAEGNIVGSVKSVGGEGTERSGVAAFDNKSVSIDVVLVAETVYLLSKESLILSIEILDVQP